MPSSPPPRMPFVKLDGGITRAVLLVGGYAIKVPRLRYGWSKLLYGLLSNMTEARFTSLADQFRLCPTVFSLPGGFLNVQLRCQPLTDEQWADVELSGGEDSEYGRSDWHGMTCDFKRDNFGTLDGRVVLLDFGEVT